MSVILVSRAVAVLVGLACVQACSHETNGPGSDEPAREVPRPSMDPGVHSLLSDSRWFHDAGVDSLSPSIR
jgi:hypothetical protein